VTSGVDELLDLGVSMDLIKEGEIIAGGLK
jgi:hypothetical protein